MHLPLNNKELFHLLVPQIAKTSVLALPESKAPDKPNQNPKIDLLWGSDLKPVPIDWYWQGWLAAGKVHILAGAPGTGKTTIAMMLAATITIGGMWPDGIQAPTGSVVVWSGEDDPSDTLVPRLLAAGAEVSRVYFVGGVKTGEKNRSFNPATDMLLLTQKLKEISDLKLLIVDPIVLVVKGDSHKNAEVRNSLQPLADLAANSRCALLGITHLSKGTAGREPVERITGSLAFGAMPRVVMLAIKTNNTDATQITTPRILLRAKSNLGPDDGGFGYDLQQQELRAHPGIVTCSIKWGDPIQGQARDILAMTENTHTKKDNGALDDAKQFLADLLQDGPLPKKTIEQEAKQAGFSLSTIRRAKESLGIRTKKVSMVGGWQWELPRRCSSLAEDAHQKEVSTFGPVEHLR